MRHHLKQWAIRPGHGTVGLSNSAANSNHCCDNHRGNNCCQATTRCKAIMWLHYRVINQAIAHHHAMRVCVSTCVSTQMQIANPSWSQQKPGFLSSLGWRRKLQFAISCCFSKRRKWSYVMPQRALRETTSNVYGSGSENNSAKLGLRHTDYGFHCFLGDLSGTVTRGLLKPRQRLKNSDYLRHKLD